eukprot:TRINITY_DN705_c0_g1_i1.p1 TRINITY_DN705_c0_g1~~TRINITY_DN705_c0_g1_i1.p1  ORF type:complete len:138 (+),score=8.07 TRINITY_DN705_c0_g1_i1:357-770(+)
MAPLLALRIKHPRRARSARLLSFALLILLVGSYVSQVTASQGQKARQKIKPTTLALDLKLREGKAKCLDDIGRGILGAACKASPIARENCALRCGAPACYEEVYGTDALEEGEIDHGRSRSYRVCARRSVEGQNLSE